MWLRLTDQRWLRCRARSQLVETRTINGKYLVTDGPFAETRELIGGFAIIQASSKQEAIELTKHFLQVAGGGETEIRQLYEAPASATGTAE